MTPPPSPPRDPGLQPERTRLAWSRTAFIMLINSVLLLRAGSTPSHPPLMAIGVFLLLATLMMYLWSRLRLRHACASSPLSARMMLLFTMAVVGANFALLITLLQA
ncbi:DUF202 domain-containing protein [Musicola paradisiaca]|uniref:DUF202 domain-containing protein n=1 Tax=Musicola paradisiaca (strain Ech703) TaxID=579405 RepID=C6C6Q0_MUSP7|nr:DUF202 domain-containing protein [Musicola paradisiaca]ACS83969.1 conserved hypothetical protein [Musicola paradisiaca Ech703]